MEAKEKPNVPYRRRASSGRKSYIVNKFALENYEHVAVFDFRHNQKIRECFQGNLTVEDILGSASVYFPPDTFVPGHTVLIFEEMGTAMEQEHQ